MSEPAVCPRRTKRADGCMEQDWKSWSGRLGSRPDTNFDVSSKGPRTRPSSPYNFESKLLPARVSRARYVLINFRSRSWRSQFILGPCSTWVIQNLYWRTISNSSPHPYAELILPYTHRSFPSELANQVEESRMDVPVSPRPRQSTYITP